MEICTIGFTKHTAEGFFGILRDEGVAQLIDVRLNNVSQLSGFAKRDDLRFFLGHLCEADYIHEPDLLAPTAELLKSYRNKEIDWQEYELRFLDLIEARRIEDELSPDFFEPRTALLCSENSAKRCHRRLVVDYLRQHWSDVSALHLPRENDNIRSYSARNTGNTPGKA